MVSKLSSPWRRSAAILALWLVCSASVLTFFFRPTTTALDEDELYWVGSAYYFNLALITRDWTHQDWCLLPARENPPVAKYVIGLGLRLAGQRVESMDMLGCFYLLFEHVPGAWGDGEARAKRAAVAGRVAPELRSRLGRGVRLSIDLPTLVAARRTMLVCVWLASGLVLLLGWEMGSWPAGFVASQLLLCHPVVVSAYNHAMSDAVALLFSCAAAWWVARQVGQALASERCKPGTLVGLAVGGGGTLALACGAKMNSLVVVLTCAFALIVAAAQSVRNGAHQRAWSLMAAGAGALAVGTVVFIAINPAILRDIPAGLLASVQEHRLTEAIQAQFLAGHLTTGSEKIHAVARQIPFGTLGLVILAGVAIWIFAKGRAAERFAGAWWLIAALAVTAWIPFERGRYVLPLVAPSVMLIGWSIAVPLWEQWRRALDFIRPRSRAGDANLGKSTKET